MTDDLKDEGTPFEDEDLFVDLDRLSRNEVSAKATAKLSAEAKHAAASFVVRAGLGPSFVRLAQSENEYDPTPEEVGALVAISFDPEADPFAAAVWDDLDEQATGKVVLSPEEARELADHLADYDILKRKDADEDPGQTEVFEWATELRRREGEATEE
jgi:hypothetical protein